MKEKILNIYSWISLVVNVLAVIAYIAIAIFCIVLMSFGIMSIDLSVFFILATFITFFLFAAFSSIKLVKKEFKTKHYIMSACGVLLILIVIGYAIFDTFA